MNFRNVLETRIEVVEAQFASSRRFLHRVSWSNGQPRAAHLERIRLAVGRAPLTAGTAMHIVLPGDAEYGGGVATETRIAFWSNIDIRQKLKHEIDHIVNF